MDTSALGTLFAGRHGTIRPFDGQRLVWSAPRAARTESIEPAEARALALCRRFLAREEHVAAIARELRASAADAAAWFDALVRRDLVADASWLAVAQPEQARAPAPLIAIRTCNRPAALRRLLDSLLAESPRWEEPYRVLVIDDAHAPHAATERAVSAFGAHARGEARYLGPSQRDALLATLASDLGADARDALRGLLDPAAAAAATGARSWNWAVLASAGGTLALLDDDFAFPLRAAPDRREGVSLSARAHTRHRFYDRAEDIEGAPSRQDAYGAMRAWLGQPLAALVRRDGIARDGLHGQVAEDVARFDPSARSLAVGAGTWGAFGWDTTAYLNGPDPALLEHLLRPPFDLRRLNGDHVSGWVDRPQLVQASQFTPMLVDNRELAPFAGTFGKADDSFFLAFLAALVPAPLFVQLPVMVGHVPPEPRDRLARSREPLIEDVNFTLGARLAFLARGLASADRTARFEALCASLGELGEAGDAEIRGVMRPWRENNLLALADLMRRSLELVPSAPPAWREHVGLIMQANRAAVLAPEATDVAAYRAALRQAGAVSRAWPGLWRRCAGTGAVWTAAAPAR